MTYLSGITIADGANLDAFSRLRVSTPLNLFDSQFTYDAQPLQFEQITNGSGASITHDTTNRAVTMTFASTPTGGIARMQSFKWFHYTPGKSQLVFITFNMNGGVANVIKFAQLGDGTNGYLFRLNGTTPEFAILNGGTYGNQIVSQSNWNLDKLDGSGTSGVTIDFTKNQIYVLDYQALYVGRVRMGFDVGGKVVYAHEFRNANVITNPYIQTASLPINVGMTCAGTVSTTMQFVCSNVTSESGTSKNIGYDNSYATGSVSAGNGSRTHLLSLQLKPTFNGLTNRMEIYPFHIDTIVTGNNPVLYELCMGVTLTGTTTFNDVNTTYSAMQYNTAGTYSSANIVVASWYTTAGGQNMYFLNDESLIDNYPMGLDSSGAARLNGRITILATGQGGASACRACACWTEVR